MFIGNVLELVENGVTVVHGLTVDFHHSRIIIEEKVKGLVSIMEFNLLVDDADYFHLW